MFSYRQHSSVHFCDFWLCLCGGGVELCIGSTKSKFHHDPPSITTLLVYIQYVLFDIIYHIELRFHHVGWQSLGVWPRPPLAYFARRIEDHVVVGLQGPSTFFFSLFIFFNVRQTTRTWQRALPLAHALPSVPLGMRHRKDYIRFASKDCIRFAPEVLFHVCVPAYTLPLLVPRHTNLKHSFVCKCK